MKHSKTLMMLLSLMLVFCTLLAFAGCGVGTLPPECTEHKDENGDGICDNEGCGEAVEKPIVSADAFNENGELYLFKNGAPTFQFVVGTDALNKHKATVDDLAELLSGLSNKGSEIPVVVQGDEAKDVEILIGTVTNRGAQYNINKYEYGNKGYVVKQIDSKLVVTGGSDAALTNALKYLKETVFGIKKNNDKFTNLVMAADATYDTKQTDYVLKDITVAGNSIRDFVITYPKGDPYANDGAKKLQEVLYDQCGIRIEVVVDNTAGSSKKIAIRNIENDGEGGGFYVSVDNEKNLVIENEYAKKTETLVQEFFEDNIFNKRNTFNIAENFTYAPDLRNITYEKFGAKGDGVTDDYLALKKAHDEANEFLLNVHADPDATYRIGYASEAITVKTNTYFHGCKFIFDDEAVSYDSKGREVSIFKIVSDFKSQSYTKSTTPIKSLEKGATNVGFKPGRTAMIVLYQDDIRHYIRYGPNASQSTDPTKWGSGQHELIMIDAEGNVDPSTPVQWTYTAVSSMTLYYVDDRPIEIKGEDDDGNRATVTTWYNDGPNAYWYYYRNFQITRSNTVLSGIEHIYDKYVTRENGGHGCPYNGFTAINNCNNVVIKNMIFEGPTGYSDTEPVNRPSSSPKPTNGGMGSYEISANLANNVTWQDCKESNFFQKDGGIAYDGNMGTNFCKNLTFDGMFNTSFDAHCGVYNGTIKNSTLEHINFIGDGLIKLENVTVYADANLAGINLRDDYGAWWAGDIEIDGLTFKVNQKKNTQDLHIVKTSWHNWDFGYTTYLPQNVTLKNILVAQYTYELVGEGNGTSNRKESDTYIYNQLPVSMYSGDINSVANDLSASKVNGETNKNPMVSTKSITLYTKYTGKYAELGITTELKFNKPTGPFFKNLEYTVIKD